MKKKVLFVMKSMEIGGVEKSLISLLNTMSPQIYDVDLLLFENKGGFLNQIPRWVNIIILNEYKYIKDSLNLPPRIVIKEKFKSHNKIGAIKLGFSYLSSKLLKRQSIYYKTVFSNISRLQTIYDTAISYSSIINYISWFVCYHVKAKEKIGWIHFDINKLNFDHKLMLELHQKMDKIFVVSKEALNSFVKKFPELKSKCELRYNIIDAENIKRLSCESVNDFESDKFIKIMTLGRLSVEKGQDIIPAIAKKLKDKKINFKWYIIGDGVLKEKISSEINSMGLENNVFLLGTKTNPYPYLKQSDIYVQTSIHEGFCITLGEAKIFGMPIVSTEFVGAHEQLDDRKNCVVVKRDIDLMYKAIISLLYNEIGI